MGRLDLDDPADWINGFVDPKALLLGLEELNRKGIKTQIYVSPTAHAKIYIGSKGIITGSANLSTRGFGAGLEIVTFHESTHRPTAVARLLAYSKQLQEIDLRTLRNYVRQYEKTFKKRRARRRKALGIPLENRLPPTRSPRLGSYEDFIRWCRRSRTAAGVEIAERAEGKVQLSGHVHRSFYGIRQFLIASPRERRRLQSEDPERYRVFQDQGMRARIRNFVLHNSNDEPDFSLERWKTYLPIELGGRATRHGGAIGSLNRMFPLVAAYLANLSKRTI